MFDLKTKANLCFKKDKIKEYLTLLMSHEGKEACHVASHYIIAVLGRYKRDVYIKHLILILDQNIIRRKVPADDGSILHLQGGQRGHHLQLRDVQQDLP